MTICSHFHLYVRYAMSGYAKPCNPGYSSRIFMRLLTLLKRFIYLHALLKQCCVQFYRPNIFDSHIVPVLLGKSKSYYRW